ncbi:hypothetical protein ACFLVA_01700 [Chloroflexota bacterium]
MEWQVILVLVIAIPIILIPVVFVWYLNIGGIYAAIREGVRIRVFETIGRVVRIALAVIVPLGVYTFLIWFFLGNFGWQVALAVALALPIVLFVPVLVWAAVVSGLYQVAREALRRRVAAPRRRAARMAEEPVPRKVT